MHRVDSFIPVIDSDNQDSVRGALEDLTGEVFSLVVLDNLSFQVVIGSGEFGGSLGDSSFELMARRSYSHHEQGKDEEHNDPKKPGLRGGLKEVSAERGGQHHGEKARSSADVPKGDSNRRNRKGTEGLGQVEVKQGARQAESGCDGDQG